MNTETIVISLGGSLIVPDDIDVDFLKSFKELILSQVKRGQRFILITGGGKIAREYIESARKISDQNIENMDWIGIAATRLNSELLRSIFGESAYSKIILDPDTLPETNSPIILGAGWRPGNSSDSAAVHVAISSGAKRILNLSNIDYVYDSDPKKNSDAKKIEKISWADFIKLLPDKWDPGFNAPFDPVAAQEAKSAKLEVSILNGKNIPNLEKCLSGESFEGTIIS